jgi:hypothetical protein
VTRWRRRSGIVLAVLAGVGVLAGCGRSDDDEAELRQALRRTEHLAHRFVFQEVHDGVTTVVEGEVEDDFRYRARLSRGGRHLMDEVVVDDELFIRFTQPQGIQAMLVSGAGRGEETAVDGVRVVDALESRRWVRDPHGAPSILRTADIEETLGTDPVAEARSVLRYAEQMIGRAWAISRYNPESLDYKPSEDPFPTPEDGSGVTRFDYVAPFFPRGDQSTSAAEAVASSRHFRKMAVYVKDGLVIRVMEQIAATGDVAENFVRYIRNALETDQSTLAQFEQAIEQVPEDQMSDFLITSWNLVRQTMGEDPIRARTMSYELVDLGEDIRLAAPAGDEVIEGDLSALQGRGFRTLVDEHRVTEGEVAAVDADE